MGVIGGWPVYWALKTFYPEGRGGLMPLGNEKDEGDEDHLNKLSLFFGPDIYDEFRGKTVIDFGCGQGSAAVEMARRGARRVIGLDIVEPNLATARNLAARFGVGRITTFATGTDEKADIILSMDAFEHFEDPADILLKMSRLLKPDGRVFVTFGYTWLHPIGGHLFSVFPWAHLILTEKTLMRWRSEFKDDGATKFGEVSGGLNQITIRKWEKILAASPFAVEWSNFKPIGAARRFHNRLTREFLTSTIQYRLRLK